MKNILEVIEKIREIENVRFDKDVANILGIEKSSLSHFKKRNVIPYDLIVNYCIRKEISIDEILGLKNDGLLSKFFSSKELINIEILNSKQQLVIPANKIDKNLKNAKAIMYENNLFVLDMFKTKFIGTGLYLIEFDNIIKIVEIKENQFTKEIIIKDKEEENLLKREFLEKNIKILGKVLIKVNYVETDN